MKYAFLGRTGVKVSRLAFGTMSFGGEADEEVSGRLYAQCRDAGVNVFDCADVYNRGRSEEILGRLVAGHRDEVVITTKAYFPTGKDVNARGNSRYHLVRAVEASLRRLGVDSVDLFFLHRHDDETDQEETLRAVEDLVRAGKILYVGASNFSAWQTMKALGIAEQRGFSPLVCTQPMYNLVKRQAEVEILPMAEAERIGVISYSPLGGGLLSGKYGVDVKPKKGRIVDNAMYATRYGGDANYAAASRLASLAAERGVHPATLAVAFVMAHPAITAPLLGARSEAQLAPLLAAADFEMDSALYAALSALHPSPPPATDRNEETSANNYGRR